MLKFLLAAIRLSQPWNVHIYQIGVGVQIHNILVYGEWFLVFRFQTLKGIQFFSGIAFLNSVYVHFVSDHPLILR